MIQIGDYRIHKADKYNWNIEQLLVVQDGKRKGEEYWKIRGHYTDLSKCLIKFLDILIENDYNDVSSIEELMEIVEDSKTAIIEAVKEIK